MTSKILKASVAMFLATVLFILLFSVYSSQSSANGLYQNSDENSILAPAVVGLMIMSITVMLYSLEKEKLEIQHKELDMREREPVVVKPPEVVVEHIEEERTAEESPELYELSPGLSVPNSRLARFIYESRRAGGPRLAIAQWRKLGWTQMELEALLDILHGLGMVTKRSAGRQCIYLNEPSPELILRALAFRRHETSI